MVAFRLQFSVNVDSRCSVSLLLLPVTAYVRNSTADEDSDRTVAAVEAMADFPLSSSVETGVRISMAKYMVTVVAV